MDVSALHGLDGLTIIAAIVAFAVIAFLLTQPRAR